MDKIWVIIISLVLFLGLVGVFFITYILNKKTPIPESCRDLFKQEASCENCAQVDCALNKINEIVEEVKK